VTELSPADVAAVLKGAYQSPVSIIISPSLLLPGPNHFIWLANPKIS